MEILWIEDFIELARTRNFSNAAAARNITQPAFSRRIRALENWVGVELIDRSSYPVGLTKGGETFLETGRELTRETYRLRDECRQQQAVGSDCINISALHSIALHTLPDILTRSGLGDQKNAVRMNATNFHDCIESIVLGRCDIAFSYSHRDGPPILSSGQFLSKKIESDPFRLFGATTKAGEGIVEAFANTEQATISLVAYSSDCFLGKMQTLALAALPKRIKLRTVYENSVSEANKKMIVAGNGVGWLPESSVKDETAQGLVKAVDLDAQPMILDILAFRNAGTSSVLVETFWDRLTEA